MDRCWLQRPEFNDAALRADMAFLPEAGCADAPRSASASISASLHVPNTGLSVFNAFSFASCVFSARIGGLE